MSHIRKFCTGFEIFYLPNIFILNAAVKAGDYSVVIYDKGCLRAGEEWVERNLIPVAGVAVAMAVLQVCY